jgi:hypothetical protein
MRRTHSDDQRCKLDGCHFPRASHVTIDERVNQSHDVYSRHSFRKKRSSLLTTSFVRATAVKLFFTISYTGPALVGAPSLITLASDPRYRIVYGILASILLVAGDGCEKDVRSTRSKRRIVVQEPRAAYEPCTTHFSDLLNRHLLELVVGAIW